MKIGMDFALESPRYSILGVTYYRFILFKVGVSKTAIYGLYYAHEPLPVCEVCFTYTCGFVRTYLKVLGFFSNEGVLMGNQYMSQFCP